MEVEQPHITIEVNPGAHRFWDRIRSRFVSKPSHGGGSGLAELLLLLPDLGILLLRLLRDERVPRLAKAIGLAGMAYWVSPLDLMPTVLLGPVGMVDDLVVVGLALSAMLNHTHPDIVRSHWPGQGDALEAIQRVTNWLERRVVGHELKRWLGSWRL